MANNLSSEKQAAVIHSLAEGSSIRSIERQTGIHRDTIMRLGLRVGEGCAAVMDSTMRNLDCNLIQMDEIWGFVGKKQKNATKAEQAAGFGDAYTFVAVDVESRMVPAFLVGKRDPEATQAFIDDLASRLNGRPQISSDAFRPYRQAVDAGFGGNVDYGQVVKVYSKPETHTLGRYSPPKLVSIRRVAKIGEPQKDLISTSYAERQNLTMRMHMRRLTRLTNGFSKKIENFRAAVALHFGYYNFCRVHKSLRQTPAMAGGVTNHVWTVPELLEGRKVSVESAQQAAERATGSAVTHLESVPVVETFRGQVIWQGMVEVYGVAQPPPDKAYAWAVESASGGVEYVAVLGTPPINAPIDAVRAWIVSQG